ncbi:oligosaccharide flippase family protein [Lysobacter sp. CFH 32150]|uniref:lipopolysaccharide biosynthesis protein n=1 Tax=Lysobacter sp. CFH 32150 TaxID=2927128 RepID=UPI001FA6CDA0|nr:oligosaccharide flippase family protein [Lysobacter sp. CFH 32150]MCI4567731.1 oligosaccharide flippase family protein [Lysobacter sp. CFH 32150]
MPLKRNLVANYLGAGWNGLVTIAFVPLYIRYLGVEAYGLIGVHALLQAMLSLLDGGMAPAISREMARFGAGANQGIAIRTLLRSVESVALAVALLVTIGVWALSGWFATGWLQNEGLSTDTVERALALMGAVVGLRFVENIYRSSLVGLQRQVVLNGISTLVTTVRAVGAVLVLAKVSPSIEAFFVWQLLVSIAAVALFAGACYRQLPPASTKVVFSLQALRSIWRYAAGTMVITALSLLLTQMDKILLSRLLSLEAFGYYAFAVVVAQLPLAVVGPTSQAFFPRFVEQFDRGTKSGLAASYHDAAQMVSVALSAITIMLVVFGFEILRLWTMDGELVARSHKLVVLLSIGTLLNGLVTVPYYLQLAAGWTGLVIRANVLAIAAVIPALLWVVPRHGAIGAAWVWLLLNAAYFIAMMPLMHRRLLPTELQAWYLQDVGLPLLSAAAMAATLHFLVPSFGSPMLQIVKLGLCAGLVLVAAMLAAPRVREALLRHLVAASRSS